MLFFVYHYIFEPLLGSPAFVPRLVGIFFDTSNSNMCKCIKLCHSEERSDEESWRISLSFKRFFAALRMTKGFSLRRSLNRHYQPLCVIERFIAQSIPLIDA